MTDKIGTLRDARGHAYVEWEIEDYSEAQNMEIFISPSFLLSDCKWHLLFYPNGNEDTNVGCISLYLMRGDSNTEKHRVSFTLGIKKSDGSVYKSFGCEDQFIKNGLGYQAFIKCSELVELRDVLLQKDTLKVFCIARLKTCSVVESASQTVAPEGSETLIENLEDLYQNERFGDVTIRVKEKEFSAHKLILAARSPVFASMFEHNMVEKKSGVVKITDCAPNSFEDFLLYLYTGRMDKVSSDNVFDLYKTADKYDIKELREKCAQYMACDMSVDSFCDAVLIAVLHDEPELLASSTKFFIENVKAILPTTKWQSFMKDHLTFTNELLIKMVNKS